jgi:hypothetical protein
MIFGAATPAFAAGTLNLNNATDKGAWITLYSKYGKSTKCIAPGGTWSHKMYEGQYDTLRVRVEVTEGSNCQHPVLADFTATVRGARTNNMTIAKSGSSYGFR